jgi:polyhydroxyalkanoate synthesis regulator phasin
VAAQSRRQPDGGVADALRTAIDRTLSVAGTPARAGATGISRERATQLLDEVAKLGRDAREELARRGQEARDELTRRGQDAGAELARRGQSAAEEMAQRLEAFERRLAMLEDALREPSGPDRPATKKPKPKRKGKS